MARQLIVTWSYPQHVRERLYVEQARPMNAPDPQSVLAQIAPQERRHMLTALCGTHPQKDIRGSTIARDVSAAEWSDLCTIATGDWDTLYLRMGERETDPTSDEVCAAIADAARIAPTILAEVERRAQAETDAATAKRTAALEVLLRTRCAEWKWADIEAATGKRSLVDALAVMPYELRERHEAHVAAQAAAESKAKAAQAAEALAYHEERCAWVKAHGSERLRTALRVGLIQESDRVYRNERLALERPGWEWERNGDTLKDIRNPSLDSLAALEEARFDRDVQLRWLVRKCTNDDCPEPADRCEEHILKGPALSAQFMGAPIVRRDPKPGKLPEQATAATLGLAAGRCVDAISIALDQAERMGHPSLATWQIALNSVTDRFCPCGGCGRVMPSEDLVGECGECAECRKAIVEAE